MALISGESKEIQGAEHRCQLGRQFAGISIPAAAQVHCADQLSLRKCFFSKASHESLTGPSPDTHRKHTRDNIWTPGDALSPRRAQCRIGDNQQARGCGGRRRSDDTKFS